ncbi:MAG: 16S rRNA (uracil(1498)-N(3))-methyltransferase [Lachnospiraceae bacterium]|nr:16S rRNA (uracil(1498)-N(3))-methyltransferase [Lachnospiraceae bacterium]MBR5067096.1 16S rRNA (uracil(1498)-N(3))-methyltransferase [Lachnospiraceae bacterium]MBR5916519.1 16S rRNA (uracil(1498)-N(3))-methyltransferase [Lachnospiraceae bacterium]
MYHFFVDKSNIIDKTIIIEGQDFNHIKNVLRMREGEEISVGNGEDENEYRCAIESFEEDRVICKLLFIKEANVELPSKVILYQCLPKADKMEMIIQKCVELGVSEIIPVASKRCVVKLDDKKASSKISRWQAIAEAAGKQSKRAYVPLIGQVMKFSDAVKDADRADIKIIPYELSEGMDDTKKVFENIKPGQTVAIFIGPEGGFDESEIDEAVKSGITPISLGKRILRTETAGMTVLAWIGFVLEVEN